VLLSHEEPSILFGATYWARLYSCLWRKRAISCAQYRYQVFTNTHSPGAQSMLHTNIETALQNCQQARAFDCLCCDWTESDFGINKHYCHVYGTHKHTHTHKVCKLKYVWFCMDVKVLLSKKQSSLRIFGNDMLGRIFGRRRDNVTRILKKIISTYGGAYYLPSLCNIT
jgi:hypothetical protein